MACLNVIPSPPQASSLPLSWGGGGGGGREAVGGWINKFWVNWGRVNGGLVNWGRVNGGRGSKRWGGSKLVGVVNWGLNWGGGGFLVSDKLGGWGR